MTTKKQKTPRQTFQFFQCQTSPLDQLEPQAARWWRAGARHYLPVALISATSFAEAAACTEQQTGAWYLNPGVQLLVDAPVRQRTDGDVLFSEDQWGKRSAWMRQADGWMSLDVPADDPVHRYHADYPLQTIGCSHDGQRVTYNDRDHLIRVYSSGQRDCATYARHRGDVKALAWSPDGRSIASGDWSNELHIWQVYADTRHHAETGRVLICLFEQPYCGEQISTLAWSPDSRYVATGSDLGFLRIWDATTGRCIWTQVCRQQQAIRAIAWLPDRQYVVVGSADGMVQVWNVFAQQAWGQCNVQDVENLRALACSPDGLQLVVGGQTSQRLILSATGSETASAIIPLAAYDRHTGVLSVAFAPTGDHVVAGCADGTVQVVDLVRKQAIHTYHGHSGAVTVVGWSTDGSRIVSGGQDKLVQVWAAPSAALT